MGARGTTPVAEEEELPIPTQRKQLLLLIHGINNAQLRIQEITELQVSDQINEWTSQLY